MQRVDRLFVLKRARRSGLNRTDSIVRRISKMVVLDVGRRHRYDNGPVTKGSPRVCN